jgi:hypothetical protein
VPDVNPIPIDKFVQRALKDLKTQQSSPTKPSPAKQVKPTPYGELPNKRPAPSKSKKRKEDPAFEEDDLRAAFSKAASTKTSVLDALQQAGHIGEDSDFLGESETAK